jgi:hypothetical protein
MCFTEKLSIVAFLTGICSSLILIKYSNQKNISTNKTIGYFFMFVSIMQIVEYLMWNDIKCEKGLNQLASMLGPLLNHLQPVIFLFLAYKYLKSIKIIPIKYIIIFNTIYILHVFYIYMKYTSDKKNLCTQLNNYGHLKWNWGKYYYDGIYFLITFVNIANFSNNKNILLSCFISYLMLYSSYVNFRKNIGELWCFMVNAVPLFILFMQYFFNF